MVERSTLTIVSARLLSDSNPTIDQNRFFAIKYTSWEGKTHQQAYDKGINWLRDERRCALPSSLITMALERA